MLTNYVSTLQSYLGNPIQVLSWVIIMVLAYVVLQWSVGHWHDYKQEKLHREKIEMAGICLQASDIEFRCNTNNGVTAICTSTAFNENLESYMSSIYLDGRRPWEKISLEVIPTYTFAEADLLRPAHTGTKSDLEAIAKRLICDLTNLHLHDLDDRKDFEYLLKMIQVTDRRLHVPFSSDKSNQGEWRTYGRTDIWKFCKELQLN